MANEFKVKNGLLVSGSANINASGSEVFSVDGTSGRLFQIDDSLSGSLFSVNTAAGLPIIEAFSDNTVRIGQYGQRALFVSQSKVGIGKESTLNGLLDISGSVTVTGSVSANNVTASVLRVQSIKNPTEGSPVDIFVTNGPEDAAYAKLSVLVGGSPYSTIIRASGANGGTATMLIEAPNAGGEIYIGTSGANRWTFSGNYNALGTGHILPAGDSLYNIGHVTSKVANYYGVNSYLSNLLNVTGSVIISGSTIMTGSLNVTNGITGSLLGTASFSTTASYALDIDGGFY